MSKEQCFQEGEWAMVGRQLEIPQGGTFFFSVGTAQNQILKATTAEQ